MRPVIVMPMYDPHGLMFPQLEAVTPQLKEIFGRAFVSIPATADETEAKYLTRLAPDDFFQIVPHAKNVSVGEDFLTLYQHAAAASDPHTILHLCFIDRVAFALQSLHREEFIADVQAATERHMPLIFQRSTAAWDTHPDNYRRLEQMVTYVGELLFEKSLDFAWCHLALQAGQLQTILPHVRNRDLSMVAELVLLLKETVQTKDVDWLSWEDPFIFSRSPQQLKYERERSNAETRKRLAYVIPMLDLLYRAQP